jgi:hypothetical protein
MIKTEELTESLFTSSCSVHPAPPSGSGAGCPNPFAGILIFGKMIVGIVTIPESLLNSIELTTNVKTAMYSANLALSAAVKPEKMACKAAAASAATVIPESIRVSVVMYSSITPPSSI